MTQIINGDNVTRICGQAGHPIAKGMEGFDYLREEDCDEDLETHL